MSKKFIPKAGEEYWAIEAGIKGQPVWWTGKNATSEKALRRTEDDTWKWTTDIFNARCFETYNAAQECNFDFQIQGAVTSHVNYDGKMMGCYKK